VFAASECFVRVAPTGNTRMRETLRWVGTRIFYVTDGRGNDVAPGARAASGSSTATVGRAIRSDGGRGAGHGPIVAALAPHTEDIAIVRHHGMTGFYSTPLDAYLRGLGVKTVIVTGVSANIAVNGTAIEAMNRGYRVIVPSDCVAGDPPEYVEQLLRFTLRNVALVAPVQGILDHWNGLPANPIVGAPA